MKRLGLSLIGCILIAVPVRAGEPGVKQTIAYLHKLQMPSGAFIASAPKATEKSVPTLRATSSAVRALHYLGAEVSNQDGCMKFVESCHDAKTGGFGDVPTGKPDVFGTAVGLMAIAELKMPMEKYSAGAIKFLTENARTFEEIRIAAAGLESAKAKAPKRDAWLEETLQPINRDGTYGKGLGQARATASRVVTVLRLQGNVAEPDLVLKALKKGQRQNGGWGKEESAIGSDLETSYRVMRCFAMLKALPEDVEGVRSFVAKCRNEDGGYGVAPGQPSSASGTYFASIILHWLKKRS